MSLEGWTADEGMVVTGVEGEIKGASIARAGDAPPKVLVFRCSFRECEAEPRGHGGGETDPSVVHVYITRLSAGLQSHPSMLKPQGSIVRRRKERSGSPPTIGQVDV